MGSYPGWRNRTLIDGEKPEVIAMSLSIMADTIVNPTDLKQHQKSVLSKVRGDAYVTIKQPDGEDLAIVNRNEFITHRQGLQHLVDVMKYLLEMKEGRQGASVQFPWTCFLREEDRQSFADELLHTVVLCAETGAWDDLIDLIGGWKATAEAYRNPELMEAWRTRGNPADYERLPSAPSGG